MNDEFWLILKSQPGIGILIIDIDGLVLFSNDQAREIYYGGDFNPVGLARKDTSTRCRPAKRTSCG